MRYKEVHCLFYDRHTNVFGDILCVYICSDYKGEDNISSME